MTADEYNKKYYELADKMATHLEGLERSCGEIGGAY